MPVQLFAIADTVMAEQQLGWNVSQSILDALLHFVVILFNTEIPKGDLIVSA